MGHGTEHKDKLLPSGGQAGLWGGKATDELYRVQAAGGGRGQGSMLLYRNQVRLGEVRAQMAGTSRFLTTHGLPQKRCPWVGVKSGKALHIFAVVPCFPAFPWLSHLHLTLTPLHNALSLFAG